METENSKNGDIELQPSFELDNGTIITAPAYGVFVESDLDKESLRDIFLSGELKNTQLIAYSIANAIKFKDIRNKNLFEITGEVYSTTNMHLSHTSLVIDPMNEKLRYHSPEMERLSKSAQQRGLPKIPESLKELLNGSENETELSTTARAVKLKSIFEDTKELTPIVSWYLKIEHALGAAITLAPSLPIKGRTGLNYAINANRLAVTIQQDSGWKKSMFFCIEGKAFENVSLITDLTTSIEAMRPEIVTIKLSNYNFLIATSLAKQNLNGLLRFLKEYQERNKAYTIFMNVDATLVHLLAQGICAVIEPISGDTKMFHRRAKDPIEDDQDKTWHYGKYPHPLNFQEYSFEELHIIFTNTGAYPCQCSDCTSHTTFIVNYEEYNKFRRTHRVRIRDILISEFLVANKKNLRVAMVDRLSEEDSVLRPFKAYYS